jgi:epoxyqueuosine reductase
LSTILEKLDARLRAEGFTNFGFAEVTTPFSIDLYDQWLSEGMNGEMDYLVRHAEDKREPTKFYKRAKTAIVVTQSYVPHPDPKDGWPLKSNAGIALYARGRDYHRFFHNRLRRLCAELAKEFPDDEFLSFTDAGPILERDLAARAGLGWIGKNTCLIDRKKGSLFLLGEIYTSLEIPVARVDLSRDFCGTCTRCLDACPTGALIGPRKLDARKCISYLTIESKDEAPLGLREKIGSWLFGCDICQTVCPWNLKMHGTDKLDRHSQSSEEALVEDLRYLLTAPNRKLERDFEATPLARINGIGLKRNALVVAGNRKLSVLQPEIERHLDHPRIGALARWALEQIATPSITSP